MAHLLAWNGFSFGIWTAYQEEAVYPNGNALLTYPTESIMTRKPYRCAVGLMMKTDEVSEQVCSV